MNLSPRNDKAPAFLQGFAEAARRGQHPLRRRLQARQEIQDDRLPDTDRAIALVRFGK